MAIFPIENSQPEPTPAEVGITDLAEAYETALMMREHWLRRYEAWFGRPGYTVAKLQEMTDGIDAASIESAGQRNAYELLTAHYLLQVALRAALPAEVMADDPTTTPVPYTLAEDEYGQRIVWDASATYPTEAAE